MGPKPVGTKDAAVVIFPVVSLHRQPGQDPHIVCLAMSQDVRQRILIVDHRRTAGVVVPVLSARSSPAGGRENAWSSAGYCDIRPRSGRWTRRCSAFPIRRVRPGGASNWVPDRAAPRRYDESKGAREVVAPIGNAAERDRRIGRLVKNPLHTDAAVTGTRRSSRRAPASNGGRVDGDLFVGQIDRAHKGGL